uniref:Uncharacterized protein n=1 Tax=Rhizophora mucronata TaxID=61149 RepID=A0A2P2KGQ1_RHIMU
MKKPKPFRIYSSERIPCTSYASAYVSSLLLPFLQDCYSIQTVISGKQRNGC